MVRPVGECQHCERTVTLVWARYPNRTTTVRAHYPKSYHYYANRNEPLPGSWCPGSGRKPKGTP